MFRHGTGFMGLKVQGFGYRVEVLELRACTFFAPKSLYRTPSVCYIAGAFGLALEGGRGIEHKV